MVIDMNTKERADKIRLELMTLTDDELLNYSAMAWAGEDIKGKPYESLVEHIKRTSAEFEKNMPF